MKDKPPFTLHYYQTVLINMAAAKGGRKDQIDVLRTVLWYADIKIRLKASSAYEVEKYCEPEAFKKNEYGEPNHRNKWSKYEVARHVPSKALVIKVDKILPGTKQFLNHVLWTVLKARDGSAESSVNWLRLLTPDIQQIVFRADRYNPQNGYSRFRFAKKQLKMLEKRAGIDALACLTIMLRDSCIRKEQTHALAIGTSLYRVLLMLCTTFPIRLFSREILDIYRERVFSAVKYEWLRFRFEDFDFHDAIETLYSLLLVLEDNDQIGNGWEAEVKAMCKLLAGDYGFHVKFALDPPIGPDGPPTDANAKDYLNYERLERYRKWGREQIYSKNRVILPPVELW